MTDDIFLTLSLLLSAALVARLLASLLPVPEILVLVAIGALLGTSALDVVDVPLDSLGAQLLFTLGCAGYGWLRPEGVRRELDKMAASWQGPPTL